MNKLKQRIGRLSLSAVVLVGVWGISGSRWSQVRSQPIQSMQITVNSPADGPVQADTALTLREAIALVNGQRSLADLSDVERPMVTSGGSQSTIAFQLPADNTTIQLRDVLPAIVQPGVIVDGTSQPGYDASRSATAAIAIPVPQVTLRPAADTEIFRGLTIAADDVTIRGLSIYGFNASSRITQATPPADIFISHREIPLNRSDDNATNRVEQANAPRGVVIEQNWLGLPPDESMPAVRSGFGVSIFDGVNTRIYRNRIQYHNGSGIITGREADGFAAIENIVVGNGLSGMPDAIRLDGQIDGGVIEGNVLCGNDGSGIFLFKPDGSVTIAENDIRFNGQRLRRAAVYVMGSGHQILNNTIRNQKGGGVVITAYGQGSNTQSINNVVQDNRFDVIEGLDIDLVTRRQRSPQDFQRGDGPNPVRNSRNRRHDTGNGAVDAPRFASPEFFVIDGRVVVSGEADAGAQIALYRSTGEDGTRGPLSVPIAEGVVDESGRFEIALDSLIGGEVLSAIATDARYGTSEPALNTVVRSLDGQVAEPLSAAATVVSCTQPPAPPAVEPPAVPEPPAIQLEVPRNVHFALDQDNVSEESAAVLNQVVSVLRAHPSIVIELHGHTDSRASVAYNQDLARRRAENVRLYLLSQGIGPERMTLRSHGETELLVEETDRRNYARNRRVEMVFQDLQGADITFVNQETDLQIEP